MEGADRLFQAVYTRFVLRDFVGKVIPGWITIFGSIAILQGPSSTLALIHGLNSFELVFFVSLAWITTIFLQSLGDRASLFKYFPGNFFSSTAAVVHFLRIATPDEKAQYERFVAIKEASGNTAVALIFVLALALCALILAYTGGERPAIYDNIRLALVCGTVWLMAIYFLRRMHIDHVERQFNYVESVLAIGKPGDGKHAILPDP